MIAKPGCPLSPAASTIRQASLSGCSGVKPVPDSAQLLAICTVVSRMATWQAGECTTHMSTTGVPHSNAAAAGSTTSQHNHSVQSAHRCSVKLAVEGGRWLIAVYANLHNERSSRQLLQRITSFDISQQRCRTTISGNSACNFETNLHMYGTYICRLCLVAGSSPGVGGLAC